MAEFQITHVHLAHASSYESHIASVWLKGAAAPSSVAEIVDAIHQGDTFFYTTGGNRTARVIAERSSIGNWFIRTHPDDTKLDNLLDLPKF